jgi:hypothetical protein
MAPREIRDQIFEVLPKGLANQIPDKCLGCNRLLGEIATYEAANIQNDKNLRSWNPFHWIGGLVADYADTGELKDKVQELVSGMEDCPGAMPNPDNPNSPIGICQSSVPKAVTERILVDDFMYGEMNEFY